MEKQFELGRYRIDYGGPNINNCVFYIRGIVDGYYVCCQWVKRKKTWEYSIKTHSLLKILQKDGYLKKEKD